MLPQADFDFSAGMVVRDRPSLTWQKDPATLRLRGRCDNYEAVRQAVEAIVNVERFRWQIYSPNFGRTSFGGGCPTPSCRTAGYLESQIFRIPFRILSSPPPLRSTPCSGR